MLYSLLKIVMNTLVIFIGLPCLIGGAIIIPSNVPLGVGLMASGLSLIWLWVK